MHTVLSVQHGEVFFLFMRELDEEGLLEYLIIADDGWIQLFIVSHQDKFLYIQLEVAKSVGAGGLGGLVEDGDIGLVVMRL
jgi:hypothetical protein